MKAGFARININPPNGTRMTGFGGRDRERGCEGIHDDIYARVLYLEHGGKEVLIMGFDLLFFSRDEADRFKGAIGRKMDLAPSQILLNTSHTHTGPKVGTWLYDPPSDLFYLQALETAIVEAGCQARDSAVDAAIWAGATKSKLPMSRRFKFEDGTVDRNLRPNPDGAVCDTLPVCLLQNLSGEPICLLFSISCHPSTISGFEISADFPGVAMECLDAHLGHSCSLFLQGTGGDAKSRIIDGGESWRRGTWEDVDASGTMVANEVIGLLDEGLAEVQVDLSAHSVETEWLFEKDIGRSGFEKLLADLETDSTVRLWAEEKLAWLDRGYELPRSVPITVQGVQIGRGLRLVGLEGEAVAELGTLIEAFYGEGVTFPLGYTNGAQLYLPTSRMLDEGGYEAVSYHEYRQPASLAKGMEGIIEEALRQLGERGIRRE
jgi:neutral ceramidase